MNWFDIPMVILILGIAYVGYRRGFLGGIFDILALMGGSLGASALSGGIAQALYQGAGIDYRLVSIVLWIIIFVAVSWGIVYLGSLLNESAQKGIPLFLWRGIGGIVGLLEGFIIFFVVFLMMGQIELHSTVVKTLKESATVSVVQKINPVAERMFLKVSNPRSHPGIVQSFRKSVFAQKDI